jgi:hypothetical protein
MIFHITPKILLSVTIIIPLVLVWRWYKLDLVHEAHGESF